MTQSTEIDRIVSGLQARWSGAFNAESWHELAQLYHPQAQLFGGRPALYEGRDEVLAYFRSVAPGAQASFQAGTSAREVTPECIVSAGIVDFRREGRERLHRMSWTLVAAQGGWAIASHHASPVPG